MDDSTSNASGSEEQHDDGGIQFCCRIRVVYSIVYVRIITISTELDPRRDLTGRVRILPYPGQSYPWHIGIGAFTEVFRGEYRKVRMVDKAM
jgi:hypothetical protein